MKLLVFHISDIHLSSERYPENPVLARVPQMLAAVRSLFLQSNEVASVVMLVAGDIAYAGMKSEYELAETLFKEIETGLRSMFTSAKLEMIFLPGNHDCDFNKDDQARQKLIDDPDMESLADGSIVDAATTVQGAFFEFCGDFSGSGMAPKGLQRLYAEHEFTIDGKRVVIRTMNSAWVSRIHETRLIMLPVKYLTTRFQSHQGSDLAISAVHHPYNWFEPVNGQALRKLLEGHSDLIVTGHEHAANTFTKTGTSGEQNEYIEGGVLQENDDPTSSSFNVILVDLQASTQVLHHFVWNGELYEVVNEVVPRPFVRNKNRLKNEFQFTHEFEDELNDADTSYAHPQKERVGLDDIFLYPDCFELDEKHAKSSTRVVSGADLITHVLKKEKVIITGADKAGKTALCRTLFKDLRKNAKIPLLLSGRDLHARHVKNVQSFLDKTFGFEYGSGLKTRYWQLPKESRAVILDDYHRLPQTRDVRDKLVRELLLRFEIVILIGGQELRFQELVGYERESTLLWDFNHLEVMAFGHRRRSEFIKKWYRIGRVGQLDDDDLIDRAISLEKTISNTLGHDLLPSYPVYILLLLQQLESANPLDVSAASYGRLYGAVLTAYLAKSGASADLETKINYLTELAYHLYASKLDHLSDEDAENWHAAYCSRHLDQLDYLRIRDELIHSQVLLHRHNQLSFRYKAGFYYFVAHYFSDKLSQTEVRVEVTRLCGQLHREAAANIVLFLCHLSKEPIILEEVLKTAEGLFADKEETDILKDAAFTADLRPSVAMPALEHRDPEQNRQRSLENKDVVDLVAEKDDESYGYRAEIAEDEQELDVATININSAIKTIQIAGQILRNFGGRLDATDKVKLTDSCYALTLRMMKWIYAGFEANETELIEAAKASICERHADLDPVRAEQYANAMVYGLLKLATLGLIKQVSNSVGLEKLAPVFAEVLKRKPTLPRRLIDFSIRLDHYAAIPVDMAFALEKEVHDSLIVLDVLRQIVFNRFYYFTAPYDIKQKVCKKLGIDIVPALLDRDPKKNK